MNLILISPEDFINAQTRIRLNDHRYTHVRNIHRAQVGDELNIGLIGGRIGTGKITSLTDSSLEMDIHLNQQPPPPLPVTLILALPRPNILKRSLQAASAMGVKKIFLIHSARVEKSFWLSPTLRPERIRDQLLLGLEQGKDTILPEVELRPLFKPFAEDELPGLIRGTLPLVAHPQSPTPCPQSVGRPVTLLLGPEGGFVPFEIAKLSALGFQAIHLGSRILRVENAIVALLSKLY